jgi:hypothetical protein
MFAGFNEGFGRQVIFQGKNADWALDRIRHADHLVKQGVGQFCFCLSGISSKTSTMHKDHSSPGYEPTTAAEVGAPTHS